MIVLLPLLAKLSIPQRIVLGRVLVLAGVLGLVIGLAAAPALVVISAVSVIVGGVSLAGARSARRRGSAPPPTASTPDRG